MDFLIYFNKSNGYPTNFENTLLEIQNKTLCFSGFLKPISRYFQDIQQNLGNVSLLLDIKANSRQLEYPTVIQ